MKERKENTKRRWLYCIVITGLLICSLFMKGSICAKAATASDVISVARNEVGTSGSPNKYTRWLGSIKGSYSYAWCHAFVSWVANQAGAGDIIPRTASCATGVQWFKNNGRWKARSSGYTPEPGDIIYFDWGNNGGYDHVGIVTSASNGRVHTIEGNAKNAVKIDGGYSNGYAINSTDILGYGHPNYSSPPTPDIDRLHPDGSVSDFPDGTYMIVPAVNTSLCLDVEGAGTSNGTNLRVFERNDSTAQQFRVNKQIDGKTYRFQAVCNNLYIDNGGSSDNDINTHMWEWASTGNQMWYIIDAGNGWYNIVNYNSGLVLDVENGNASSGTNIRQHSYNGSNAQKFRFVPVGNADISDGTYAIVPAVNTSLCLDVEGAGTSNGTNLRVFDSNDSTAQQFRVTKQIDGRTYRLQAVCNNLYVDNGSGYDNDTNTRMWEWRSTGDQMWYIVDVGNGWYTFVNYTSKLVLDVENGNASSGTNIRQHKFNGSNAQKFRFVPVGNADISDGTYMIVPAVNTNLCFDVEGAGTSNGTNLRVFDSNDSTAQQFRVTKQIDGKTYRLQAVCNNLYVDNGGGYDNDTNTRMWEWRSTGDQMWYIVDVGNGWYTFVNYTSKLVLDVENGNASSGTNIRQHKFNRSNAQKFRFVPVGNADISDGDFQIISALNPKKGLDIDGTSSEDGANIQLHTIREDNSQVFTVSYLGNGCYKIINKTTGTSLEVEGASTENCSNVISHSFHGNDNQKWIIRKANDGYYYIYSKCNGLMLDVWNAQTDNGTNIQMHSPTGSKAQLWRFVALPKDSDKTIESGDYHIITASDKTKSLDLYEYNPVNKTPIGICGSATNKRQVFSVDYLGNGYYTIRHREAESAVEIYGALAYKGTKVTSYENNGSDAQQWIIRKSPNSPYYNIVSKCGGFSINGDTSKPDHFVNATLEIGDGSPTQDWLFIPDEDQKLKAVTKELNAALTWNALSWADTYDLNIKDASGKDFSQKGLTDTTFMDQLPAGTYTASVTSRSDVYTLDSDEITFTTKRSAEDTVIEDITFEGKTYTYDGTPKSLAITQALPEGVSVKYSGNDQTDAGTYTVTAQFTDSTGKVIDVKSADLVIDPKDVSKEASGVAVEPIPDQTYTGRETIPEPVVKDGEAVLQKDTDYTVSCKDNINVGEATATITFKGNYSGTKSLGFHINKAANSWKSALSCQDVVYGTGLKPAAEAAFGKTTYQFAKKADGTYSDQAPATAGTWYIKALVEGTDNYSGLVSDPVEVKITKAVYDLDGLTFEDKTVTYDGEPRSLTVKGQLPLGVSVAYDGNGEAEAGTYTITAHFEGDSNNYQPVPDMTATLTIEPRPVPIPEGYNDLVYNGEEQYGVWWDSEDYTVVSGGTATEAGTHEATVRLADKKNTAWEDGTTEDKKVSWTIAGAGNEWTEALTCPDITYGQAPSPSAKAKHGTVTFTYSRDDAMTFTGKVPTEAGTYYVRARVQETEEYAGLENIMEFTIKKASYDMANVSFGDSSVDYDGRQKSITVKGDLPEGLAVSYEGNGKYNAGSYEVKAKFTGDDNHEPVPAKTATLTILPKKAEDLTFGQIADRTYSGREMEPEVDVESDYVPLTKGFDYEVEYKDNKEAGAAKAVVTMKGNYEGTKEIPFTIRQAKNKWKTALACPDIPYGTRPEPAAEARFGKVKFIYSDQEDGDYTDTLPGRFGTWFVKAAVEETANYTGLESDPVQFAIKKHTHVWDKGKVTREPTCTEAGVRTFTCGDCGDTKTEPITAKGHKEVTDPAVAATRTSTGLTEGSHCSVCGTVIKKQSVIPKLGNGNTGGNTGSAGNGQGGPANPSGGSNNGSGDPSGNQQAAPSGGSQGSGTQTALVKQEKAITSQKGDGDPKGSTYRILCARVKKSAGNSNTLGWKKVSGATGYIVYGNQCGAKYRFTKLAELKGTTWIHKKLNGKKLKKGTYYKYIVVAVKDASGNKTVLATSKTLYAATAGGKAGNPGMLTVKKKTITLKRNKTSVIKVSQKPLTKKQKISRHRKVCFESDNPKIATVTASGKVKGLKKGSCKIYVYAQNGLSKVIKVRVN